MPKVHLRKITSFLRSGSRAWNGRAHSIEWKISLGNSVSQIFPELLENLAFFIPASQALLNVIKDRWVDDNQCARLVDLSAIWIMRRKEQTDAVI